MKLVFPRFDASTPADALAPDFAVLLAGLSANQSASATARHQILLENKRASGAAESVPPVDIFAHKASPATRVATGSFNPGVARSLSDDSGK